MIGRVVNHQRRWPPNDVVVVVVLFIWGNASNVGGVERGLRSTANGLRDPGRAAFFSSLEK